MRVSPIEQKIADVTAPVIEDLGFALVCVRVNGEGVQIMAEDPKTRKLGLDDAAKISRAVSAILDVEDPIEGSYRLEVSSPGIDRPLVRAKDFEDFAGFEAKIETDRPTETGQKKFRGRLRGLKDENILLATDQGEMEIPLGALVKAKLILTDELIKATAGT